MSGDELDDTLEAERATLEAELPTADTADRPVIRRRIAAIGDLLDFRPADGVER